MPRPTIAAFTPSLRSPSTRARAGSISAPWSLPSLDEGHELVCIEGAVWIGRDVLGRDSQGLFEAHELPALVVEAGDFHDSFLATAFDIAIEEASSQASAAQQPVTVALCADRCGNALAPLTVAPSPLTAVRARLATEVPDPGSRLIPHDCVGLFGALNHQALRPRQACRGQGRVSTEELACFALPGQPVHRRKGHRNKSGDKLDGLSQNGSRHPVVPSIFSHHMKTLPNQPTHM